MENLHCERRKFFLTLVLTSVFHVLLSVGLSNCQFLICILRRIRHRVFFENDLIFSDHSHHQSHGEWKQTLEISVDVRLAKLKRVLYQNTHFEFWWN